MAKEKQDREDLLRDATAYVRRVELTVPDHEEPVFCGFRENDALSVYFGQDNVLQFNADRQLRRAFWRDQMLASYRHTVHWLTRSEGRVRLTRTPLSETEQREFHSAAYGWLTGLQHAIVARRVTILGVIPESSDVVGEVSQWLHDWGGTLSYAMHPGS